MYINYTIYVYLASYYYFYILEILKTRVPAPAQVVPASSLPELREDLAQRLFCTPCPEVEACAPLPPFGWASLACALLLGVVFGVLYTSCCCGTAVAGFAFGHHGNRPRLQGRFTTPRPIRW